MQLTREQSMMLGIVIGDAFGMAYEFVFDRTELPHTFDFTRYSQVIKPGRYIRQPGMYTDDTQMSIAVAELLASEKEFTPENLAQSFIECYKRDPISGYSRRMRGVLDQNAPSARDFLAHSVSASNGAAMRSVPLGVLTDIGAVIRYATINASLTHNTSQGIASSAAVGLMSHYHFHNIESCSLFDYVEPHIMKICPASAAHLRAIDGMCDEDPETLFGKGNELRGIPADGMRTAGAALYILSHFKDPSEILRRAVMLGGDTDSVAAVSLGITMINHPVDELPEFLFRDLTNHMYGRNHLLKVGMDLSKKFNI